MPESRTRLFPDVAAHVELLTASLDQIHETHRKAGAMLVDWIVAGHEPGRPSHITVICTGNSRRSVLGAMMGNIAAAYHGMPEIQFHSGGTEPSAFNPRTIATLKAIGVQIEPTGEEAPRGPEGAANPIYRVRWGTSGDPPLECREFSKTFLDPTNPQSGFAALLVCGEADAGCPFVPGAAIRISMPYDDPKTFDDTPEEPARYAERRDDMGRLMLSVLSQVRDQSGRSETTR